MKRFNFSVFIKLLVLSFTTLSSLLPVSLHATGYLETPVANSPHSGISTISGWHCTAETVEVYIDGKSYGQAGTNTLREDTTSTCGHSETGFSLLFNYGALENGAHTIDVYVDGVLWKQRSFVSYRIAGKDVEYARGLSESVYVQGFPNFDSSLTLVWVEEQQGFVASGVHHYPAGYRMEDMQKTLHSRKFIGVQRLLKGTEQIESSSRVNLSFTIEDNSFGIDMNSDSLGRCVLKGNLNLGADRELNSHGLLSCEQEQSSGSYSARLSLKGWLFGHLQTANVVNLLVLMDHSKVDYLVITAQVE